MLQKLREIKGYTLGEILIFLVYMGIMVGVAAPDFINWINNKDTPNFVDPYKDLNTPADYMKINPSDFEPPEMK